MYMYLLNIKYCSMYCYDAKNKFYNIFILNADPSLNHVKSP